MTDFSYLKTNLDHLNARIETAAKKAARDRREISLLMATKTRTPEEINAAIEFGYGLLGENRVQEFVEKAPHLLTKANLSDIKLITPRENHFIGQLQGNKVADVCQVATCIQSVDRLRIARRINDYCTLNHINMEVFIQVNTSREASKSGLLPEALFEFLVDIKPLTELTIRGLMTIGLHSDNETNVRDGFALLRNLRDESIEKGLLPETATELSMGMSGDLELAILEGATMIRVGSDIFGQRDYS